MDKIILRKLRARRVAIRKQWIALLKAEPIVTPLGHPEALWHLIDQTLDQVFAELGREKLIPAGFAPRSYGEVLKECACGRNPLLVYFMAGEKSLLRSVATVQAELGAPSAGENDVSLSELYLVLRRIARREVKDFCALCQHPPVSRPHKPFCMAGSSDGQDNSANVGIESLMPIAPMFSVIS